MEKYFNFNDITDTEDLEELRIKLSNENYANAIINDFLNRKEIIVYNQAFNTKAPDYKKDVDRSRKYFYDEKGRLQKKDITDEEEDFNMLLKRLSRSRRRALDNFLGYAYCNNFKYFITTTFDKTKVDRDNPKAVKYATKLFKEKLSYHFKDIAILHVFEEHAKDGCLHLHGFLGGCNLSKYLTRAINNRKYEYEFNKKTGRKIFKLDKFGCKIKNKYYKTLLSTEFGDPVYNFKKQLFVYGNTSVVLMHKDENNDKLSSYLSKYMLKNYNSVNYGMPAYHRSKNLKFKFKENAKSIDLTNGEVMEELFDKRLSMRKQTDKLTVFVIEKTEKEKKEYLQKCAEREEEKQRQKHQQKMDKALLHLKEFMEE